MEAIRFVAITEPASGTASASGTATMGTTGSTGSGRQVLDRVMSSRLDRVGAAVRWGVGSGADDAAAAAHAAIALERARERGMDFGFLTGDAWRDALLVDLALVMAALLDDLTPRQAEIAGRVLVDGSRQAAVAAALGVSRATVSVAVARGRLPAIAGARRAIEALLAGPLAATGGSDAGRAAGAATGRAAGAAAGRAAGAAAAGASGHRSR